MRLGPEKYTTLRAFATATSSEKTVESGIRYSASTVPSRSVTEIAIRARLPSGSLRMARVRLERSMARGPIPPTRIGPEGEAQGRERGRADVVALDGGGDARGAEEITREMYV